MFETFRDNGAPQFLTDRGTLPLHTKWTNATGNVTIPFEVTAGLSPIAAVRIYPGGTGVVSGLTMNTDAQANASGFRGSVNYSGSNADVYLFSAMRNRYNSWFGLQTYNGAGGIVYDAQDKPVKPVDIVTPNWTLSASQDTNWTDTRYYDGSKQFAVAMGGVNRTYRYRWTGQRYYDTSQRNWNFTYITDYSYMGVRFVNDSTIQFYTAIVLDGDGQFEANNTTNTPPLSESWSSQTTGATALVLDVTGY